MRYIIPSIGRCASSVMAHQLHKASGSPDWQYRQDYANATDTVIKTHAPFTGEPPYDYRAVFCTGRIGDVIASMYLGMDDRLIPHLHNLGMDMDVVLLLEGVDQFAKISPVYDKTWEFLIRDDKFGFKRNIDSWREAKHVLFVHYDQWEANPIQTFARVSKFTGLPVVPRELKPRRGRMGNLPPMLQEAIRQEYGDLA